MISMCYLISFLLNEGKIKDLDFSADMDPFEAFKYVADAKKGHTLGDLCWNNAECLEKFALKVFSL